MSDSIKTKTVPLAAALCCLFVAYAVAQPGQPGQPVPPQPPTGQPAARQAQGTYSMGQGQSSEVDQYLASCLLIKNQGEIELSKIAAERSQNSEVKKFAQQMITDHQAAVQQLQQLAGPQAGADRDMSAGESGRITSQYNERQQPAGGNQPVTADPSRLTTAGATDRDSRQGDTLSKLAEIEKQIAQRATQAMRAKLEQKQGAEFDHCYVGSQVGGHLHMLAALEVIKDESTGRLRQVAQDHHAKVKEHLDHAEQLAEQLMTTATRQAGMPRSTEGVPRTPR